MNHQAMQIRLEPRVDDARYAVGDYCGQYRFGAFVARSASRDLTCHRQPVCIGSRAFDLLIVLLRSQGEIVAKEEIFQYVWPSTTVDESNLRFQMAALRKALGSERDRIKTIPGRGYLFIADEALADAYASRDENNESWLADRPAIVIIDRNPETREALHRLLLPFQAMIQSFGSLEAFLESTAFKND